MCGIAGYINLNEYENSINEMLQCLSHRGPDDLSILKIDNFIGGMVRLSINDLEKGAQPLYNSDKSVVLFYNGEIYNSPQLRKKLESKGYIFRTRSDGEVICHLYDEYGHNLFSKLDGMFAIALYDTNSKKLYLARDYPGEKPLYYCNLGNGRVIFASELKSIIRHSKTPKNLDYQSIWDFPTFLFIPDPNTIFKNVKSLERGNIIEIDSENLKFTNFIPEIINKQSSINKNNLISSTKEVVTQAVESRLLSDVPIGSFLSGGLDSSIVSYLASRTLGNIDTFSIGFDDINDPYHGKADESEQAKLFAKELNSNHHSIKINSKDFKNDLRDFCKFGDQPFAVSSGLGVLRIAKEAKRENIKVLLSGDCADECFGGYSWYEHLNKISYVSGIRDEENPISFQNFGLSLDKRLSTLETYNSHLRAWAWHYYAHEKEKSNLFTDDLFSDTESSIRHFIRFNNIEEWTPEEYIKQDRNFYMPFEMLTKVDRMTMAYSVEGRVPFASPSVLAHSDQLVFDDMVRGKTLKWVLRQAFKDEIPTSIIDRPKHGFNIPIDFWLKGEWWDLVEESFSSFSYLRKYNFINQNSLSTAKKMLFDKKRLNGHTIFCFIMLNMWLEENL